METLDTDKSVLLVTRDTMGMLLRAYNEWNSLTVKMTDADEAKLVRGELASILEIPKGGKAADSFKHPFQIYWDAGTTTFRVRKGRVQMPSTNGSPRFITLDEQSFVASGSPTYIWVKVWLNEGEDTEENAVPYHAEFGSGGELPPSVTHTRKYTVTDNTSGTYTCSYITVTKEIQEPTKIYVIGWISGSSTSFEQWIIGDIIADWTPATSVEGFNGTMEP